LSGGEEQKNLRKSKRNPEKKNQNSVFKNGLITDDGYLGSSGEGEEGKNSERDENYPKISTLKQKGVEQTT